MLKNLLFILLCSITIPTLAQEHFYDFIYRGADANPTNFNNFGNQVYFTALNANSNNCLYKSDGTTKGTVLVFEFTNGANYFRNFTDFNGKIFFTTGTPNGTEIWYTEGTKASTKRYYQSPSFHGNREINLLVFKDWLFYQEQFSEDSFYIKRLDTTLSKDIIVSRNKHGYQYAKGNFVTTSNYLFYSFNDQLYRVDDKFTASKYWERSASAAGDIPYLYVNGNTVIFHMRNSSKTDVYAIKETGGNAQITATLYGYPAFYDWVSNGNFFFYIAGEYNGWPRIYRLNTQNFNHTEIGYAYTRDRKLDLEIYNNEVYYSGFVNGDCELYKVGNLSSAPIKVKDITSDTSSNPQSFMVYDNKLFFSAFTKTTGRELYASGGNAGNTQMAFDFFEGKEGSNLGLNGIEINGKMLLSGYTPFYGSEIWVSDGTAAGTELLLNINSKVDRGNQQVSTFMPVGDYLYMFANDSINGAELWRTDGSKDGTILLDNINIDYLPSGMEGYTEFKGNLYGTAVSFLEGIELYKSDGTPSGSGFVTPSDLFSSSAPRDYVVQGNYMYFIGRTGLFSGDAIFRSDGTKTGTKAYLATGTDIEEIANLTKVGNMISVSIKKNGKYGAYYVDTDNDELKPYDQVNAQAPPAFYCGNDSLILYLELDSDGNLRQHNIIPPNVGTGSFSYASESEINSKQLPDTFFMADSSIAYMVVLMSDNSKKVISYRHFDKATQIKKGVGYKPLENYTRVESISGFGTKAIFSAYSSTYGQELFITDGTDSGTVLLADINQGSASSNPDNFYLFKDKLIFSATTADQGREVWITDGTTAGTKLLWDIQPGTAGGNPTEYSAYKGYLYIAASDSIRERSLYRFIVDSCDIIDPKLVASNSNNTICDGQSISLYAKTQIAVDNISWLKNGSPMAFTNDTFTTNEIAKYQFVVKQGSCSIASNEIELTAAPAVSFTAGFESDSGFCAGESVVLIATGNSDLKVKWYKNDEEYSSNLQTATFTAGAFYAIGKNQYGCADTSRTLQVIAYDSPKPIISYTSIDTLFCNLVGSEYTFQWFFKGAEITGETNYYLVLKENGAYKVVVTNANGCSGESIPFKYEGNSIEDIKNKWQIAAYPNPFTKQTNISYTLPTEKWVNIEIYNTTGQKISTLVSNKQTAGAYQHTFLAQNTGVYFVKINIGSESAILRMVKAE